jgi:hypothetical protein
MVAVMEGYVARGKDRRSAMVGLTDMGMWCDKERRPWFDPSQEAPAGKPYASTGTDRNKE